MKDGRRMNNLFLNDLIVVLQIEVIRGDIAVMQSIFHHIKDTSLERKHDIIEK